MYMNRFVTITMLLLATLSCSKDASKEAISQMMEPVNEPNIVKILFIGNSLTFFNDGVDFHVGEFYDNGEINVLSSTSRATSPGFSLADHLGSPATMNKINSEDWDYIVLQENGIVATTNPDEMIASVTTFKNILDATSSKVFFYLTWAYDGEPQMTNELLDAYTEASAMTGYKIIPVGLGWRDFQQENNGTNLLGPDGVHPSMEGTYFASAMLFKALSNQDVNSNPYLSSLIPDKAQYIKEFVTQAFLDYY